MFEILGLERRFDLDPASIDLAYRARAAALHPDLADPDKAADAARASAALNDARATLADPERRANALLAALGGPSPSEDRSLPRAFLMEMMDVRQEAEEECSAPEGLAKWQAWADAQREEAIADVAALFAESPDALAPIRERLNSWRYVERMIEQLDPEHESPI
ncbi:MAG: hypothetical protein DHS20C14_11140 [Phycisphaeraceae bacterium]|nr:MAG: hypothetical protein DHS20C14_11140 [Phycisphaeraceae bacterium]